MSYDTTNLRLSVLNRLLTCDHRSPALDRDIDIVLGLGRRCTSALRHNDNYVMRLHSEDWVLPNRWTSSPDVAMSIVPPVQRAAILVGVVTVLTHTQLDAWKALPSRIIRAAMVAEMEGTMTFEHVRPHY